MELIEAFKKAKEYVCENYPDEVEWSSRMIRKDPTETTATEFTLEYAWCIYVAGFRASVVRKKWPELTKAYMNFDPVKIMDFTWKVKRDALKVIAHRGKTERILKGVAIIATYTPFEWFKFMIDVNKDLKKLRTLPGIGPTLSHHLARNIGVDTIKPDIHLSRMGTHYGLDPFKMCSAISDATGLAVHLVDTILWRASVDRILDFRHPDRPASYEGTGSNEYAPRS